MTLAVRGISQHTFCELRFADLLFVTGRQCIPRFVEDGPQENERRWIVWVAIAHGMYSTRLAPLSINEPITTCRRTYDDDGHKLFPAVRSQ